MNTQDLINKAGNKFIKDLNGEEFTIKHFRSILFGYCSNMLKSSAKESVLVQFIKNPNVQIQGVGRNGELMDKLIKEMKSEEEMWRNLLVEELLSSSI